GTYSFHPRSPDEKVTVDVLKGVARGERRPDLVVCVLDATNLRRGLKLVMAAQRLKLPAVVAVNMMDLARRRGIELKAEDLSRELGVPVVETIAVRKQGIDRLTELLSDPSAWSSWVPEATEEDDLARLNRILRKLGLDKIFPDEFSDRIDRVVLNPWLGVTILMIILFFVFQAVFAWSAYPMEWIEEGFNMLGELCAEHLPDGFVKDLLVDAVIGGVGGVVVFLPQILILFFFILLMEESGYLPRAAFLLDRTMGSVGLSGRSFLPLLSGYACAVPAIMAARIVGNQRDRWATIAIAPLLTCGARLPVYAVMIAAFVPDVSVWGVGLQGLVLFALYCLGMVGALVVAWILKHTTGKGENRTLMLELPSYHLPRIDALAHGLWQRACIYLQKVGPIILAL
ncbi:MAG: FeoB small GTPase domain-containing protein, partial [Sutterella wadsworthensis]